MDKETLEEFLNLVEVRTNADNGYVCFSSWHCKPYDRLVPVAIFLLSKSTRFIHNDKEYDIKFECATDGIGGTSDGSPDTWTVTKVVEEKIFNADDFLNKNIFQIHDSKNDTKRVEKLGYNTTLDYELKDLFEIAENIFDCGYNIQIVKQLSGDVILMIENKNFIVS